MKKFLWLELALYSLTGCNSVENESQTENNEPAFEFPAEWEPHAAVWTDLATDDARMYTDTPRLRVIRHLSDYVKTKVVYDDDSLRQAGIDWLIREGADTSNITFVRTDVPMNWVRDETV